MLSKTFSRYTLGERIGEGGMGVVYRAHDASLGRDVAIKVISSEQSSRIKKERFLREIQLAASLQHPNIVPVHDVGEFEGQHFYVMPLVEGETLRARMHPDRGLAVDEALRFARDIGDALDYAHRKGIVHRDIKPDNVLISNGKALVLDFGLAIAREDIEEQRLTQTGAAVGTPLYMSPEQASGAKDIDGRSDIYSLACLLYEMLSGEPPFVGANSLATLQRHFNDAVPSVRHIRAEVPINVDRAISKALGKRPDDRFATAAGFVAALADSEGSSTGALSQLETRARPTNSERSGPRRRQALAVAAVSLLVLGYVFYSLDLARPPSTDETVEPIVAVLPFANLSDEASLDAIGVGVAETLITQLSTVPSLRILAGALDGSVDSIEPQELARELGASHVVRGTIQKDADRTQVSVTLIRADNTVSWGGVYESTGGDWFELQQRISEGLSTALSLQLSDAQQAALSRRPTDNRDAYAEYVQGRAFLQRRDIPGNLERATTLLESATSKDGGFALAHAALGETFWQRYRASGETPLTEQAIRSAQQAKTLDPNHPYVRYALAVIYEGTGRTDDAIRELTQALELQPRNDDSLALLGQVYAGRGSIDEAVPFFDRAIEGRPGFWGHYRDKGQALFRAGRYEDAAEAFERVTELQPDSAWGFQQLGVSYHTLGDLDRALDNYNKAVTIGASAGAHSNMGTIYYRRGDYSQAVESYSRAIDIRPSSQHTWRNLGDAYLRLDHVSDAHDAYVRAIEIVNERLSVNAKDGRLYSMRALYYAKLQREAEALGDLERAATLGPPEAGPLARRAEALALLGRDDDALDALEQAIDAGLTISEIQEIDELESLRQLPRYLAIVN